QQEEGRLATKRQRVVLVAVELVAKDEGLDSHRLPPLANRPRRLGRAASSPPRQPPRTTTATGPCSLQPTPGLLPPSPPPRGPHPPPPARQSRAPHRPGPTNPPPAER